MTSKNELIRMLQTAYAMGKAMTQSLDGRRQRPDIMEPLRAEMAVHRTRTHRHAWLMGDAIRHLGGDIEDSSEDTCLETLQQIEQAAAATVQEAGIETMLASHAAASHKLAFHLILAAAAQNLGEVQVAQRVAEVAQEERRFIQWLEEHMPHAARCSPADRHSISP